MRLCESIRAVSTVGFGIEARNRRRSANQLGDGGAGGDDEVGAAGEVGEGFCGFDSQVAINGGEEVAGFAEAVDDVFAAFVGGADDAAGFDAAAGPEV